MSEKRFAGVGKTIGSNESMSDGAFYAAVSAKMHPNLKEFDEMFFDKLDDFEARHEKMFLEILEEFDIPPDYPLLAGYAPKAIEKLVNEIIWQRVKNGH